MRVNVYMLKNEAQLSLDLAGETRRLAAQEAAYRLQLETHVEARTCELSEANRQLFIMQSDQLSKMIQELGRSQ